MRLNATELTEEEFKEIAIAMSISKFARVDRSIKMVNISERILNKLNEEQKLYLNAIKNAYGYSLQYTIE